MQKRANQITILAIEIKYLKRISNTIFELVSAMICKHVSADTHANYYSGANGLGVSLRLEEFENIDYNSTFNTTSSQPTV